MTFVFIVKMALNLREDLTL